MSLQLQLQVVQANSIGPSSSSPATATPVPVLPSMIQREYEDMYADEGLTRLQKLESLCDAVLKWLNSEAKNPLTATVGSDSLNVRDHTTYGRMVASLMESCTCNQDGEEPGREQCFWHCSEPNLNDVIYEIILVVYEIFDDQWTCFGNLALDMYSEGGPHGTMLRFSMALVSSVLRLMLLCLSSLVALTVVRMELFRHCLCGLHHEV